MITSVLQLSTGWMSAVVKTCMLDARCFNELQQVCRYLDIKLHQVDLISINLMHQAGKIHNLLQVCGVSNSKLCGVSNSKLCGVSGFVGSNAY